MNIIRNIPQKVKLEHSRMPLAKLASPVTSDIFKDVPLFGTVTLLVMKLIKYTRMPLAKLASLNPQKCFSLRNGIKHQKHEVY